jgi:hypothetical protein
MIKHRPNAVADRRPHRSLRSLSRQPLNGVIIGKRDNGMERDDLVREVYAHFGLALYKAQVLEHGLTNAMMYASKAAGRLPTLADFDAFLGDKFDRTLGALIKELRNHISVDPVLEGLLQAALKQRNWLAHHYFRERSEIFISDRGCVSMIAELETAQDLFKRAEVTLDDAVRHLADRIGVTKDKLNAYVAESIAQAKAGG